MPKDDDPPLREELSELLITDRSMHCGRCLISLALIEIPR